MSSSEMEQALAKIRPHDSSSLPHQKAPATLLRALEATLDDQKTERSPTAYYAVLLTTLEGTLQKERATGLSLDEGDVLPAELYLLALVAPHVPHPVVRANLNTLLSLTAPLFPAISSHAPALRSQLALYGAIYHALDRPHLEVPGIRQSFASVLQLCLDARPKVRRKAVEVVRDVLFTPPSPLLRHPYADRVAEWIQSALATASANPIAKGKGKKTEGDGADTAIHLLAFLRPVLLRLPPASLPTITTHLLTLPRLGNPYLSQSAYSILSEMLTTPSDEAEGDISSQVSNVLKAVLSSLPSKADATLAPAWLVVLGNAMVVYSGSDPEGCAAEVGKVWKVVWTFLESGDTATRRAAAQSLDMLAQCFTPRLVAIATGEAAQLAADAEPKSALGRIVAQTTKALDSLALAGSVPEVLTVISSLIDKLRYRADDASTGSTAAEVLMLPLIEKVSVLRVQKSFEYKEGADGVMSMAMAVLGPAVLLERLPLNLEPADRQAGREPRAFLLPLLPQPHPSPLSHFVSYFVPLSERMFEYQSAAEMEDRQSEAKVWSVLIAQIWAGLVGYCYNTPDLSQALTGEFSQLLSQLLYSQQELRPAVLKALRVMVESNVAVSSSASEGAGKPAARASTISTEQAAQNVAFLSSQSESWLAVLFNVFGSADRNARTSVSDVISAWASITSPEDVAKAYQNVITLFKQNLTSAKTVGPEGQGNVAAATQDLLVTLLPYLSSADASALFKLCLWPEVLNHSDNGVQKRGYKILGKLVESGRVSVEPEEVLKRLDELADGLLAAAKKDRFHVLSLVVQRIPASSMHLIPSLIPETVLGTKEPSEKARGAAFDLIVSMGRKMSEGGVVKRGMVDGMEEDGAEEAPASLEEYVTMIAGGLAGASPHMISATVTALSRIVFEFKDAISADMHTEIITTLLVFLSSTNREIVKSTLGYIKLVVHTLPAELVRPHLPQLVPALLRWSHDHKNHFKPKVRHVFERMIRRFGWDAVYGCAGEEEARKVLVNIKKRKERAKRKKAAAEDEGDDLDAPAAKAATGDAFEDVLYGSESELDESDNEAPARQAQAQPKKKAQGGARLRVDDDEPMDLLQGATAKMTSARTDRRRKPGQDAARFKTDDDTGRMVIDDNSDSDSDAAPARSAKPGAAEDVEGVAYRESITSVDGFTRGANGRVKFNKNTKKRRRENVGDEDVEMGDASTPAVLGAKKTRKNSEPRLGHEFKAKKAGGDVKKGGVDPYAYLSLSQAAKKKGGKSGRIGIAGKR